MKLKRYSTHFTYHVQLRDRIGRTIRWIAFVSGVIYIAYTIYAELIGGWLSFDAKLQLLGDGSKE